MPKVKQPTPAYIYHLMLWKKWFPRRGERSSREYGRWGGGSIAFPAFSSFRTGYEGGVEYTFQTMSLSFNLFSNFIANLSNFSTSNWWIASLVREALTSEKTPNEHTCQDEDEVLCFLPAFDDRRVKTIGHVLAHSTISTTHKLPFPFSWPWWNWWCFWSPLSSRAAQQKGSTRWLSKYHHNFSFPVNKAVNPLRPHHLWWWS